MSCLTLYGHGLEEERRRKKNVTLISISSPASRSSFSLQPPSKYYTYTVHTVGLESFEA